MISLLSKHSYPPSFVPRLTMDPLFVICHSKIHSMVKHDPAINALTMTNERRAAAYSFTELETQRPPFPKIKTSLTSRIMDFTSLRGTRHTDRAEQMGSTPTPSYGSVSSGVRGRGQAGRERVFGSSGYTSL